MASTRRQVIGTAAAAFAASTIPGLAAPRRWRVGVVGAGWFGKLNAHALMQVAPVEIVALADVDRRMLEAAAKEIAAYPDSLLKQTKPPALYKDYRTMLSKHHFDIVIVATPDHWHALPAIAAMNAGAHLYLEKPVSIDLAEAQVIAATAQRTKRIIQVGTQRRTSPCHIEARDRIVREGKLGKVGFVELYAIAGKPQGFPPPSAVPEGLDWEFYCGPAPLVAYNEGIHPRRWRAFRAFGNGAVGDLGVHFIDLSRWTLGLGSPQLVTAQGGRFFDVEGPATIPDTQTAQFTFGDVTMSWMRREWGAAPSETRGWGAAIYGDKGTLKLGSANYEFTPLDGGAVMTGNNDAEMAKFPNDPKTFDRQLLSLTRCNMRDFVKALETGGQPASHIGEGVTSTACAVLANLAMDLKRSLRWDGKAIVGDAEAQQKGTRDYRAPWKHPIAT